VREPGDGAATARGVAGALAAIGGVCDIRVMASSRRSDTGACYPAHGGAGRGLAGSCGEPERDVLRVVRERDADRISRRSTHS